MPPASTGRTTPGFFSKAFKEGISSLMDELKLAFQWGRPSILVAVHREAGPGQEKARARLRKEIEAAGKTVREIEVNRENPNVIQSILRSTSHGSTVFFVSGIGHHPREERDEIYRALNFHREMLVDHRIILILWLASAEAAELPLQAPDFWAFRHRVVEFAPDRKKY
jgi:hypothetical protein